MRQVQILTAAMLALVPPAAVAGSPQTVTLDVENMTCALCPITVKKALEKVPGVAATKVDSESKLATVTYDPDVANPDMLVKATTEAGYPSAVRP